MGKILTVDDSMIIRTLIKNTAETLGYQTLEAENGRLGYEVLKENYQDVDLIVLDINMPEMSGHELLEKIKATDGMKEIPCMMVTTEAERTSVIKCIKAGAANYVIKPFTPEDLATKMVESLGIG